MLTSIRFCSSGPPPDSVTPVPATPVRHAPPSVGAPSPPGAPIKKYLGKSSRFRTNQDQDKQAYPLVSVPFSVVPRPHTGAGNAVIKQEPTSGKERPSTLLHIGRVLPALKRRCIRRIIISQ